MAIFEFFFYCKECESKVGLSTFSDFICSRKNIAFNFIFKNDKWIINFYDNRKNEELHYFLLHKTHFLETIESSKKIKYGHDIERVFYNWGVSLFSFIYKAYIFVMLVVVAVVFFVAYYLIYNFNQILSFIKNNQSLPFFPISFIIIFIIPLLVFTLIMITGIHIYFTEKEGINIFWWERKASLKSGSPSIIGEILLSIFF
ncbi:hypothetical protein SCLARK_001289 [Spiroplasma clarkii]|nr:hypothetical protein SCLARK_001289 [Spiroplasma clarkii]